jgi:hypothetical protein
MKRFLAVYVGTAEATERSGWNALDPAKRREREQAGIKAWMDWATTHRASIVEMGSPLGKTKRTAADGVTDIKNALTGYTVVMAETHEAAAKLFLNHPHFTIFPGDSVEIMECLPIPGQ